MFPNLLLNTLKVRVEKEVIDMSKKIENDICSVEFRNAMDLYFNSILNIIKCHEVFAKYDFKIDYAVPVIQKSLQNQ